MNKIIVLLFSILVFFNLYADNQNQISEEKEIVTLIETFKAFESDRANQVWPGFTVTNTPSVIHFSNGHIYSFYMPLSSKWKNKKINHYSVLFSEKDHWDVTKIMMHPNYSVEGKPSFVFRFDNGAKHTKYNLSLLTFVHERFHLHQFSFFAPQERKGAQYIDEWEEQNHILAELENQTLKKFILSQNRTQKTELLKDFIAINKTRLSQLHPSSIDWEDNQQRMEGLADYVSLKAFEVFSELNQHPIPQILLEMREKKTGVVYSLANDIIKSRHYFVGSVLGFALDFCNIDWKEEIEKGSTLRELLYRTIKMSNQEIKDRYSKLVHSKDFESMKNRIFEKLNNEKNEKEEMLAGFYKSSGTSIYLGRPKQSISGGGRNQKSCNLGQGHLLAQYDTSFSSTKDQRWKLKFNKIPFIFEDPFGSRIFKLENETILKIDNHLIAVNELSLNELSFPFKTLSWESEYCEFAAEYPGFIYSKNGKVYIKFVR